MHARPIAALMLIAVVASCGGEKKPAEAPEPVASAAPEPSPPPPPPAPVPLFDRLGKREGLEAIVDELLGNVLADKRMGRLFDKVRRDKERAKQVRARFVDELCVIAGGDCSYGGKPMNEAHKGMKIRDAQWDAFVEDLTIALKTRDVPDADAEELVAKIAEVKGDVVSPGKAK